jgi:hypothetical protein
MHAVRARVSTGPNRCSALIQNDVEGWSRPNMNVAETMSVWAGNRLDRLTKSPKRYVVDGAMMAAAL